MSKYMLLLVMVSAAGAATLSFLRFLSFAGNFAAMDQFISMNQEKIDNIRLIDDRLPKLSVLDPASEMNEIPAPTYHLVISTGCTSYQDWQTYAMFYHAAQKQVQNDHDGSSISYVTRVVSGCNEEEKRKLNELHKKTIEPMAPGRFFLHHTPSFRFAKPKVDYVYFNKASGYHHWMVNALRFPYNAEKYNDVTYILLDPDQFILKPFTNGFGENELWGGPFQNKRKVERGQPFAQEYAMGTNWLLNAKMEGIAPMDELPSPIKDLDKAASYAYQVGPPYIMKGYDLWRVVQKWTEFNPYVYDQLPDHITEMYTYSIAAAHLNLPHAVSRSLMVSNPDIAIGEGWPLIEDKEDDEVCLGVPEDDMPHVLHFCQNYGLGKYFFSKYKLPTNFISCEAPLLREPPRNIATSYNYMHKPNGERRTFSKKLSRRNAFALCYMIRMLNDAAEYFKRQHCPPGAANFNKTLVFHDNMADE